ncbi:MAG: hypothetical protein LBI17_02445 [Rickettsiales bacterium]|jgi:hypothetical protein|nr:hypothetical protein [Rickettsiales bacterium]
MRKFKVLLGAAMILLAGCKMAETEDSSIVNDMPMAFSEFTDVPIPENSMMIMDETSIFGRENNWVGTLTYQVPFNVITTFDFYMSEMPKFGWTEITSIRGQHSVLNFTRRRRVVLITLDAKGRTETKATLVMSPAPVNISRGIEDQRKQQSARIAARGNGTASQAPAPAEPAPVPPQ